MVKDAEHLNSMKQYLLSGNQAEQRAGRITDPGHWGYDTVLHWAPRRLCPFSSQQYNGYG
jgi:hypothetical protein